ncbi:MAG: hypothetical protein LPK26_04775 [Bacillaceae bacterium]|nr:hypothetical protein [Bacillaceae bacterium]
MEGLNIDLGFLWKPLLTLVVTGVILAIICNLISRTLPSILTRFLVPLITVCGIGGWFYFMFVIDGYKLFS